MKQIKDSTVTIVKGFPEELTKLEIIKCAENDVMFIRKDLFVDAIELYLESKNLIEQGAIEESDKALEERTERNMNVISDFIEHIKNECDLEIPESAFLSFFNA